MEEIDNSCSNEGGLTVTKYIGERYNEYDIYK